MRNQFIQTTKGYDAEVILAPVVAYTTQATVTNFVNSAAEGAIGIYNVDTQALITGAAIASDVTFEVAIKRNGIPEFFSPTKKTNSFKVIKQPYVAPVAAVYTIVVSCGGTTECRTCACCADDLVEYSLRILDTQSNDTLFAEWNYGISGKKGKKIPDVLNAIRTFVNDPNGKVNIDRGQVVTMSAVTEALGSSGAPNTYTFTLTATAGGPLNFKRFKVVTRGFCDILITETTPASEGINPFYDMIEAEREGALRAGWNAETPGYPFVPSDFPHGTDFSTTTSSNQYTTYLLISERFEDSTVRERHYRKHYQLLMAATGSALETSLNTIFGV